MGPLQKDLPLSQGVALLEAAFARGVNFLDTAEIYRTYPYVKEALHIKPDAVVATKCYAHDAKTADASFRGALKGIGREYIDIFLLHEQESEHTLRGHGEALDYFLKRRDEGAIGAVGISTHHIAGVRALKKRPELNIVHPMLNMLGLGIADGTREDMERALEELGGGVGVYAMKALGGGHLIDRRREALDYVLSLPYVDSVAIGMQSLHEVEYACDYFSGLPIDEARESSLNSIKRRLFIHNWCSGCGKCTAACKSGALSIQGGRASVDDAACVLCGYCAARCPDFCLKVI